ncbi:2-nitropropane dioxygenase [Ornithinimicrobium sediminis]|uniref:2-nitropropane dioxygenase n=1 Tax=Ornithinimicrobium sediminis TaxID=2904603 RepID=UPI001E534D2C|nr:2-nitropropane dioxygenase [Ornithinimicrobium sediminis]MCE0486890.1 2-nitropropane dioxygenase [Ornithinimicrobium sediminis]
MSSTVVEVPPPVRILFGHAALQVVADAAGVDLLHIKGPATEPELRSPGGGTDADVLVRPSQCVRFVDELSARGWSARSTFLSGSDVGHAATFWHPQWGYADVHRFFQGISPKEAAFDILWAHREMTELAGVAVAVPTSAARHLIAVLNALRNRRTEEAARMAAALQDPQGRVTTQHVEALVAALGAEVGWAAAQGRLEEHRGAADYWPWRATIYGTSRMESWVARLLSAPRLRDKALVLLRAPLVNIDHLAHVLGRRPTVRDVVVEFFERPRRGLAEEWQRHRTRTDT